MKKIFTLSRPLLRNILIGCFSACTASFAYSQAALSTRIISLQDTVYLQSAYNITVSVKNTGNASCTDSIIQVSFDTDSLPIPKLLGDINITLPFDPGDSVMKSFSLPVDSSGGFTNPGTYIVVVWATGSTCKTADSALQTMFVLDPLSTYDIASLQTIKIYPNPVSSILFIESVFSETTIESVRITDMLGKTVLGIPALSAAGSASEKGKIKTDLSSLQSGVYILEVMNTGGQKHRMKCIKSPF